MLAHNLFLNISKLFLMQIKRIMHDPNMDAYKITTGTDYRYTGCILQLSLTNISVRRYCPFTDILLMYMVTDIRQCKNILKIYILGVIHNYLIHCGVYSGLMTIWTTMILCWE